MSDSPNWVIELARKHRPKKGDANIFGVIIYTDRHAHVKKMLDDDAYWKGLDEASGPRWPVFATRAAQGSQQPPTLPPDYKPPPPWAPHVMLDVWKEPRENNQLLEAFELQSTRDLPALVIFCELIDETVLKRVLRIPDKTEAEAYNSLRKHFEDVAAAIEFMRDWCRRRPGWAFDAVEQRLDAFQGWELVKSGFKIFGWIKSAIGK